MKYATYNYNKFTRTLIFAASCISLLPTGVSAIVEGGALNFTSGTCTQSGYQNPPGGYLRTCTTTGVVVPVILTDAEAAQVIPPAWAGGGGWRWGVISLTGDSAGTAHFGNGNHSVTWLSNTIHTTYGSAVTELKSMVGQSFTASKTNYSNSTGAMQQCAGLLQLAMDDMYPTYVRQIGAREFIVPLSQCQMSTVPPTPAVFCAPVTQRLDFNFGTLSRSEAVGKSMSKQITVQCSASNVAYKLTLPGNSSSFRLTNNMNANVTTSKGSLGTTIYGPTSETFDITVTLNGQPTTTGAFQGSSILMVTYP